MQTKLALFCDKLIEAGWLGIALLIPLFFNVYSSRVFEPDKLTVFRGIILIMIVAWVVKTAEDWSAEIDVRSALRRLATSSPISLLALIFVAVYLLATATSIDPGLSFWGSYQRLQGTLNNLGYVALFFLVLHHLRSRAQLERLFTVILLTSLPISLYGIVQHFGLDPLPWGGDVRDRVTSSLGNAIFLAAYLIMALPLTLVRLARATTSFWQRQTRPNSAGIDWWDLLFVMAYMGLLVLQLVAILYTKSRGPWLGLGAGVGAFALLLLLRWRRWVLFGSAVGILALLGVFLVLLNLDSSPVASLRHSSPYLERLGTMLETSTGTNRVRVLIWRGDEIGSGALGLITASPYRFVVGYGPETMYVAYNPFYPPDLAHYEARNASPDRSHNDLLDFLVTMGLIGLVAYLALVATFFVVGLRLFWRMEDRGTQLVVAGLLAAVVAHLVEAFFGIAIAATRTHFWLYLAAVAALAAIAGAPARAVKPAASLGTPLRGRPQTQGGDGGLQGLQAAAVGAGAGRSQAAVVAAGASRTAVYASRPSAPGKGKKGRSSKKGAPLAAASSRPAPPVPLLPRRLAAYPLLIYLLISVVATPVILLGNLGQRVEPPYLMILGFAWIVVGLLAAAVWVERPGNPRVGWRRERAWLYVPLAIGSAFVIVYVFLGSVIADIYFKKAQAYDNVQRYEGSIPAYLDALRWTPNQDFYFLFLGRAYLEMARRLPDQPSTARVETVDDLFALDLSRPQSLGRDLMFNASLVALKQAYELNPRNTDNSANLARLHRFWAQVTSDPAKIRERYDLAVDYYRQATALSPHAAHLYDEWGVVYHLQGRYDEAVEKYQQSLRLDRKFPDTYVYLGDVYLAQKRLEESADMYRQALALDDRIVGAHSALGYIYQQQGRLQDALAENLKASELAPNDLVTRRNLAIIYNDLGLPDKALAEAEAALRLAPKDQQAPLQAFIEQLKQRKR